MRKRLEFLLAELTLMLLLLMPGICAAQTYRLAVLPRYFPIYMHERFTGLANAIEADTGLRVALEIADSYDDHMDMVKSGLAQFSFQNPLVYIKVASEVVPVAVASQGKGGTRIQGVIIVRKDGGIANPQELKGKKVSVVSTQSAGGYLSQKEFLKKHNLDVVQDLFLREAADHLEENVIMDVFEGRAAAGFISAASLHRMDQAIDSKQIRVLATTSWVPSWIFAAHRSVDPRVVEKLRRVLLDLSANKPLVESIGVDGFVAPDAAFLKSIDQLDFW